MPGSNSTSQRLQIRVMIFDWRTRQDTYLLNAGVIAADDSWPKQVLTNVLRRLQKPTILQQENCVECAVVEMRSIRSYVCIACRFDAWECRIHCMAQLN